MNQTTVICQLRSMIGFLSMEKSQSYSQKLHLIPLGKPVTLTHYVDANLFHDALTGRSVTGILHMLNATPIDWYSKKQSTVETATYGSEFVAARTCVEQIVDLRNTLEVSWEFQYMRGATCLVTMSLL